MASARVHTNNTIIWRQYKTTEKALKQLLLGNVGDINTSSMNHRVIGYLNVTTRQLIIPLYAKCGNIRAGVLEENEKIMKTSHNPNHTI